MAGDRRASARPSGTGRWTPSTCSAPTHDPHATAYVDDMVGADRAAGRRRRRLRDERRRVLRGRAGRRTTGCWPASRSTRCGPAPGSRRPTRSGRRSTSRCGRRPSRASRRGRHRGAPAGPDGTPSAWSCRSTCWARASTSTAAGRTCAFPHHENERAQAVADGKRVRRALDPQRLRRGRGREDVQVARQLHQPDGPGRPVRPAGPTGCWCCGRTTGRRSRSPTRCWCDAVAALDRLDSFARRVATDLPAVTAGAVPPTPRRSTVPGGHGRRPRTPAAMALLFDLVRRANAALDADDAGGGGPRAAAVLEITGALGLELRAEEDEVPAEVRELARRRDEARPRRTGRGRRPARRDRRPATRWRTRPRGGRSARRDSPRPRPVTSGRHGPARVRALTTSVFADHVADAAVAAGEHGDPQPERQDQVDRVDDEQDHADRTPGPSPAGSCRRRFTTRAPVTNLPPAGARRALQHDGVEQEVEQARAPGGEPGAHVEQDDLDVVGVAAGGIDAGPAARQRRRAVAGRRWCRRPPMRRRPPARPASRRSCRRCRRRSAATAPWSGPRGGTPSWILGGVRLRCHRQTVPCGIARRTSPGQGGPRWKPRPTTH